jgi:hypothetical protein
MATATGTAIATTTAATTISGEGGEPGARRPRDRYGSVT